MSKNSLLILLLTVTAIVLLVICYMQYSQKNLYRDIVSHTLSSDFQRLSESIRSNDEIYDRVLSQDTLSHEDAELLARGNETIYEVLSKSIKLAVDVKKRKEPFLNQVSPISAQQVTLYFNEREGGDVDEETRSQISSIKKLNTLWLDAVNETQPLFGLGEDRWIVLIEQIEQQTLAYLDEMGIEQVEQLWLSRTEIN